MSDELLARIAEVRSELDQRAEEALSADYEDAARAFSQAVTLIDTHILGAAVGVDTPPEQRKCQHCGALPDADGDHSCPCPYSDADCTDHQAQCTVPFAADRWGHDGPCVFEPESQCFEFDLDGEMVRIQGAGHPSPEAAAALAELLRAIKDEGLTTAPSPVVGSPPPPGDGSDV